MLYCPVRCPIKGISISTLASCRGHLSNESLSPLFYSKKPCSSCGGTKVNANALKACISSPSSSRNISPPVVSATVVNSAVPSHNLRPHSPVGTLPVSIIDLLEDLKETIKNLIRETNWAHCTKQGRLETLCIV